MENLLMEAEVVLCMAVAPVGLFSPGGLAVVAALSGSAFMLIFLLVAISNYRLRCETGSNPHVLRLTIALFLFVIAASYLADPMSWQLLLAWVLLIVVLDFLMRTFRTHWFIFRKHDLH